HLGVDVDIVRDLQVVHHRVEHFVHFALRRHQADSLEAVHDVIFRLAVPGALRLKRSKVVGRFGFVLYRSLDQDFAQFLLLSRVAQVISPNPRLCPEVKLFAYGVVKFAFLAIDEGGQPETGLQVGAPAIKMEIPAGVPIAAVSAVEPYDVVILVFHPDASEEAAFSSLFQRRHVEHQAADFTEKLLPHVIELVVLLVEAVRIDEDHLKKSAGDKLRGERKEVADSAKNLLPLGVGVRKRDQ